MRILDKVYLEANSPKKAWYVLELVELAEGFAIIKHSGSQSAKGIEEAWFRLTLEQAEKKFSDIKNKKMNKQTGRIYIEVPSSELQEAQLPLLA